MNAFAKLGLSDNVLEALAKKGFENPTPIQEKTIPLLLQGGRSIVGQASTGTGKTAAFGLPIIECIEEHPGHVQALILTPTRELALQVSDEINSLKGHKRIRVLPVYGGQPIFQQLKNLKRGVDVVVGTPGRIMDHIQRGSLHLDKLSHFILDEADEMCNMGFIDDVRAILAHAGPDRNTLLFSATMPREVMRIAAEFMGDYEVVSVKPAKSEAPLTRQVFHEMHDSDRLEALCRVIDAAPAFYGLVFCRTRRDTDLVADRLAERGYPAAPIHGDLSQARREEILDQFRRRRICVLVATDVAARGIDVPDLTHVVNFALPQDPETYTHRVGRTGRAGKEGVAITLIAPNEFRRLMFIARNAGFHIDKAPLPRIEDVIHTKKSRACSDLAAIMEKGKHAPYLDMARNLLEEGSSEDVVAALLRQAFGAELDPRSYRKINDRPVQSRNGSRKRLTIFMGRAHGMSPKKLVDYVSHSAQVPPFKIQNLRISGKSSTFTAPPREAERIMRALNKGAKGRPLVSSR